MSAACTVRAGKEPGGEGRDAGQDGERGRGETVAVTEGQCGEAGEGRQVVKVPVSERSGVKLQMTQIRAGTHDHL